MSAADNELDGTGSAEAEAEVEVVSSAASELDISLDDVFQKDGSSHSAGGSRRGGGSNESLSNNGSWGYASVERRLDLNASLDLEKQQGRLKKMLKSVDEGLEPKQTAGNNEDEKKEMDDSSRMDNSVSDLHQSSGELKNKEGGGTGFKVPKTLRSLHKKRDKLRALVDEFEEDVTKIFHKIEKLSSKVQIQKDGIQERSASEEYSLPQSPGYETIKSSSKKKNRKGEMDELSVTTAESEVTEKASNKGGKRTKKLLEEEGLEEGRDDDDTAFFDWKLWKKSRRKGKSKGKGKNKKLKKLKKKSKAIYYDWKRHRKNRLKAQKSKRSAPPPPPAAPPVKIPKAKWWVRMSAAHALGWKKQR